MTDARSALVRVFRPSQPVPASRGSLTRRALEQKPLPPGFIDGFLAFNWYRFVAITFLLAVAAPTALTTAYFAFIASPVFISEARFAVRQASDRPLAEAYLTSSTFDELPSPSARRNEGSASGGRNAGADEGIGGGGLVKAARGSQIASLAMTAIGSAPETNDPYVVANFIGSRDIVQALDQDGWLRARFSAGDPDWYQAFSGGDAGEELLRYWRLNALASVDTGTGLIHLTVNAFTAEDAYAIASRVVEQSEALVNRLTERLRRDRMAGARAHVQSAESRYLAAEAALRDLRNEQGRIDPVLEAESAFQQVVQLISARINLDVQLRVLSSSLDSDAPQLKVLRDRMAALDSEIEKARARLTDVNGSRDAAANYLAMFEQKETERLLASKFYSAALDDLERTRLETERQGSYLAVFVPPEQSAHASGPSAVGGIFAVLIASLLLWGLSMLLIAATRDHLA
jgi:capsular polysaccharide transport system permease protein